MNVQELYKSKRTTAAGVAENIQPGWSCCTDIGASFPQEIIQAINDQMGAGELRDITLHSMLDLQPNPLLNKTDGSVIPVTWFSGGGLRRAVQDGRADVMPCYYRDMPSLFTDYVEVDAFITTVSPMDKHGYFSTGVTASNGEAIRNKAKSIFLQVNDQMPRSLFGPQIHISQVAAFCECSTPLPVTPATVIDDVSRTIGSYIADEVADGSTLQLGIGAVPEAVGNALKNKRNLGIHTELFTESMLDLIECGAVTNLEKPIHTGKNIATFTFGSERIYRFIDDNPTFELLPVNYVNDPAVISMHPQFISVNSAVEVDFFGQVCAESIGTRHVSGTGGQADFVRGAVQSKCGKSFIAFPSTAQKGAASRIRPTLTPGALVTTSKNDVDYIVTEYGAAKLRGRTLSQRTRALINIAHPKFRDELTAQAKKQNILI